MQLPVLMLARASSPLGTSRVYVESLAAQLDALGPRDEAIQRLRRALAERVRTDPVA